MIEYDESGRETIICPVCGMDADEEPAARHILDHGMCWGCLRRWKDREGPWEKKDNDKNNRD